MDFECLFGENVGRMRVEFPNINDILGILGYKSKQRGPTMIDPNLLHSLNVRNIKGMCTFHELKAYAISYTIRRYLLPNQ